MEFFLQQTLNGLTLGSVYALLAIGYSMVYGILKLLNFAHGEVYMFGAFAGYGVLTLLGGPASPVVPVWLLLILMFAGAVVVSSGIGVAMERFAYRPLRQSSRIAPLISAIGVSFFLQASALFLFTAGFRTYDAPKLIDISTGIPIGPIRVWLVRVLVIVGTAVVMVVLTLWVNRSRTGKAVRAVSFDREAAEMMGVNVNHVIGRTFQTRRVFLNMTVKENVMAAEYGATKARSWQSECARRRRGARSNASQSSQSRSWPSSVTGWWGIGGISRRTACRTPIGVASRSPEPLPPIRRSCFSTSRPPV